MSKTPEEKNTWISSDEVFMVMKSKGVYTLFDEPADENTFDSFRIGNIENLVDLYNLLGLILSKHFSKKHEK